MIVSDTAIVYGGNLKLGVSGLVADNFDQFDYLNQPVTSGAYEGRWAYYAFSVQTQKFEPLSGFGGGEVNGTAWTPYVGHGARRPFSIQAAGLTPVLFGGPGSKNAYKAVLRYTVAAPQVVTVKGSWDVSAKSEDGVDLSITLNGRVLASHVFKGHYETSLPGIRVSRGDRLDFVLGPNATFAGGDATSYRIKIYGD